MTGLAQADEPHRTELEQVVISASRSEQELQDAITQVYVITADDIKKCQIKNVQWLLRIIPDVRITEITGS